MTANDPRVDAYMAGYRDELVENAPKLLATFTPFLRTTPLPPTTVPAVAREARLKLLDHIGQYLRQPYDVTVSGDLQHGSVWVGGHVTDQGWTITLKAEAQHHLIIDIE